MRGRRVTMAGHLSPAHERHRRAPTTIQASSNSADIGCGLHRKNALYYKTENDACLPNPAERAVF